MQRRTFLTLTGATVLAGLGGLQGGVTPVINGRAEGY